MKNVARVAISTIFALVIAALVFPTPQFAQNGPPSDRPGQGDLERADPCVIAPDAPGEANGIDRRCALGASSGVAKGDFNGDNIADLAVGVPDESRQSTGGTLETGLIITDHDGAGAVNVIYGGADGLTATGNQILDMGFVQNFDNNHFGKALAAGNFRGTGHPSDLAVAVPGLIHNGVTVGAVAIHFSDGTKLPRQPNQTFFADQFSTDGTVLEGLSLKMPNSPSMTWGDFNGDSIGDLAVEVATCKNCNPLPRSAVLVLYGAQDTGFSTSRFTVLVLDDGLSPNNFNPPTGCFTSQGGGSHFCATSRGHVALSAADLNGDSRTELLIGAPNCLQILDDGSAIESGNGQGCVAIVRGRSGTLDPFFRWNVLTPVSGGPEKRGGFGAALAVGDFDDDGLKDIAVGAPTSTVDSVANAGAVRVFPDVQISTASNSPASFSVPSLLLTQNTSGLDTAEMNDRFGTALAANNFNDGFPADLAIGAPAESTPDKSGNGMVHIIYGVTGTGLSTAASTGHPAAQNFAGFASGDAFGSTLSAWNFGHSTHADLAIGSPNATVKTFRADGLTVTATLSGAGTVMVLYGSVTGLQSSPGAPGAGAQVWSQLRQAGCNTVSTCTSDIPKAGNHFGAALY